MKADILLAAGIAALSFCASGATAATLYAVDYPASANLYTVDQSTGALTVVGAVGLDNVGDLTSDEVSRLWGVQITTDSLVSINPTTGLGTLGPAITGTLGPPTGGPGYPIASLAWDPFTDVLYGNTAVSYGGETADELYTIDTTTGAATDIGTIGENSVYALGFAQSGQLYGVDGNCNLINISTTTGVGTVVGPTGLPLNGACGGYDIASSPDNDVMYLADFTSVSLYTVNLGTGAATVVGPYGGSSPDIVGLAFLGTSTPEPGTIVLLAAGMGLIGLGAKRGRSKA